MRNYFREMMIDITKLQADNARAEAKHQKFKENWQEEQTRDIDEMNEDRIKHPFARCWDDQTDEEVQTEHWNKERV